MKIKVMQVIGQLRIGGAENVAMNLYRYIDRNIFEFHYLVYNYKIGDYEREVFELGGKVIHINYSYWHLNRYKRDLLNTFKDNGPYDIIHVHTMFHNGVILQIANQAKIPLKISHAHTTRDGWQDTVGIKTIIKKLYINYMRKLICNNSDLLVACSQDAGIFLYGKLNYKERGMLLKNGIHIAKYIFNQNIRNTMRKNNNISDKRVYGCIGHFDEVKNHVFLIDVFEKISQIDKNAVLILLGDGILKPAIQRICAEKQLSAKVFFFGNVQNVHEWLQAMDFLLMPSLYEGFPLVLVEAQVSGLKCFVSDTISREVNITGKVRFLPLFINEWTFIINEEVEYDRSDINIEQLLSSEYNVFTSVRKMEEIYLELLHRKGMFLGDNVYKEKS